MQLKKTYETRTNTTRLLRNYEPSIQKFISTPMPKNKKLLPYLKEQESSKNEI